MCQLEGTLAIPWTENQQQQRQGFSGYWAWAWGCTVDVEAVATHYLESVPELLLHRGYRASSYTGRVFLGAEFGPDASWPVWTISVSIQELLWLDPFNWASSNHTLRALTPGNTNLRITRPPSSQSKQPGICNPPKGTFLHKDNPPRLGERAFSTNS